MSSAANNKNPPCKNDNARFTTVPLKLLSEKNVLYFVVFQGLKVFNSDNSYVFSFSKNAKVTFVENPQLITISF